MPVTLNYDETLHTIRMKFIDPWGLEDVTTHYFALTQLFNRYPYRIHTIFDMRNARSLPSNLIGSGRGSPFLAAPNRGLLIDVGAMPIIRSLTNTMMRVFHIQDVYFVEMMEEAEQKIVEAIAKGV